MTLNLSDIGSSTAPRLIVSVLVQYASTSRYGRVETPPMQSRSYAVVVSATNTCNMLLEKQRRLAAR